MDQNYVQRYHTAKNEKQAVRSVWMCVWLYVPASLLFFIIGVCLYGFYQVNPEMIEVVKLKAAAERLTAHATQADIKALAATLQPADYGDKVMPHFMVTKIPTGLLGLIISAILSAAMSTISSGMNSSATVFSEDIYQRYIRRGINDKQKLRALYLGTVVFGLLGMLSGIAMIGAKSILDVWWELSGIFAAGMLGIFLLGIISRRTKNHEALIATIVGVLVIIWMTFSYLLPDSYGVLKNTLNKNMVIVIGTLSIFLTGVLITRTKKIINK